MFVLIPVDGSEAEASKITTLGSVKKWALVPFDAGEVGAITFFDEREAIGEAWIDFVVLENRFENILPFMEAGMMVLVRREEETIEEIMEAFKFKELDEVGS